MVTIKNKIGGAVKLNMSTDFSKKKLTIVIKGDIDHHSAKSIREAIDHKIEENSPNILNLDFSKVQFMDSSGIGLIMGRYKLMSLLNGKVEISNLSEQLSKIIKLSGLSNLVTIKN